jgi:hypothetical protein
MNREDVIRMAREAGIGWLERAEGITEFLERFAALVYAEGHKDGLDDSEAVVLPAAIKAEREACAQIVEKPWQGHFREVAAEIRARGQG